MISKKEFVEVMNRLKEASDIQDKIGEIFRNATDNVINDFMNSGSLMISHEDVVIKLLEDIFNSPRHKTWGSDISWWIYETDYGRKKEMATITYIDTGETLELETPEAFYDYLIKEYVKEKEEDVECIKSNEKEGNKGNEETAKESDKVGNATS